MKRVFYAAAIAAAVLAQASPGYAENWIFARSYYSHAPANPVQIGRRSSSHGLYYTRPQGEWVRTGYRNLQSDIRIPGQTTDRYRVTESWIQYGAQF